MPRSVVGDSQPGFVGGIDSATAQGVSPDPTRFADIVNARVLRSGEVAKRPGLKVLRAQASLYAGFAWADPINGKSTVLMDGTNLRACAFNQSTGAITVLVTTACSAAPLSPNGFAHFHGPASEGLYITSVGDYLSFFDGATVVKLAAPTPTSLRSIWVYNQRLFGVTSASDPTLYWSGLNNGHTIGDTANGGGSATIRTYGGQGIKTGGALGGSNYIIHGGAVSVFRGLSFDDIAITAGTQGVSPDVGGVDDGSFKVIDGIGYLVSARGLVLVTEQSMTPYSVATGQRDPLAEAVQNNLGMSGVSIADNVRADEIWIACYVQHAIGDPNVGRVFIYNKTRQRFTGSVTLPNNYRFINLFAAAAPNDVLSPQLMGVLFPASSANSRLVGCDFQNTALESFQDFTGDALQTNYTSSVTCHRFFTPSESSTKAWRWGIVRMGAGALGTSSPASATGATLTSVIGGTTVVGTDALPAMQSSYVGLGGSGQSCDLTITDGGTSTTGWSVARVDVQAFDMGQR